MKKGQINAYKVACDFAKVFDGGDVSAGNSANTNNGPRRKSKGFLGMGMGANKGRRKCTGFRRPSLHLAGNESAVLVRNLCKGYSENGPPVLNNLSMNVIKGTIYGLLGSSGCGKTTALSCIVGLKKWESGEIYVFGQVPGTKESGIPGKCLGYVPQEIALYEQLTIKENIQYYGRLYGMREREILERWQLLVNLLHLPTDFKLAMNLSGGQRRRTSLALALVHHPSLLILDEPTVGLDPLLRESVWDYLFKLVRTKGTTVIITTHYIEEAKHSDRIGVMRHGRLIAEDCPHYLMSLHKTDILENVVLKLCWADSNKAAVRYSRCAHIINGNNNNGNVQETIEEGKEDGDSDEDSGTGTDEGRHNEENQNNLALTAVPEESQSDISNDNDNALTQVKSVVPVVPQTSSNNVESSSSSSEPADKRRNFKRSTSSEFAGVLFQSKWKPELESVVVTNEKGSLEGKYKKTSEFDLSPVPQSTINFHSEYSALREMSRPKRWLAEFLHSSQKVAALCLVTFLSLIRHPVFFLAALVLPAVEVLLTVSTIGREPRDIRMAVVNDEMPDWVTRCQFDNWANSPIQNLSTTVIPSTTQNPYDNNLPDCNFNELSCKYLNTITKESILDLVPYESTEEAINDVELGYLRGYIHFGTNYSQHMLDRLATKQFAFEESINGSMITLRMDMSEYIGSFIVIKHMFDGLEEYVKQLIGACDLGSKQAEIPLHYRKPVYGSLSPDFNQYMIPGVLANIMFMMPFAISGLVFITDRKLGTMNRARAAGLTSLEFLVAYTITQGAIVMGQVIVCTLSLIFGFNFQIIGSTLQYIGITMLVGMSGQSVGLIVGMNCNDELEALITAMFVLPFMLMYGGIIWPLECMAPLYKYIGYFLPTSLIAESLRSTVARGVVLTHGLVWPGIAVALGWLAFGWVVNILCFRRIVK